MKNALIITLGTRDVSISKADFIAVFDEAKWKEIYNEERSHFLPKTGGAFFLQAYKSLHRKLLIPIIQPAIEHCIKKCGIIDAIILVATDQNDAKEVFTRNDTFMFARILQQLLVERYQASLGKNNPVRILTIKKNVSFLDNLVDDFNDKTNIAPLLSIEAASKVYVLNQSGIPPVNTALMLKSIALYGDKAEFLRVSEEDKRCYSLKFTLQFLETNNKELIRSALSNYDYGTVVKIARTPAVLQLAKYALHRLYFDFETAEDCLKELRKDNGHFRKFITELDGITSSDFTLLQEVYVNAKIKLHQKAYVDFLLRSFRIVEAYGRSFAMEKLDFVYNHNTFSKDIKNCLAKPAYKDLKDFLDAQKFGNGTPLQYRKANIPVWIAITRFYNKDIADSLDKMSQLSHIRNKSIGAHDFKPVSLKIIEAELARVGSSLDVLLKEFDVLLQFTDNPFDRINAEMEKLLDG